MQTHSYKSSNNCKVHTQGEINYHAYIDTENIEVVLVVRALWMRRALAKLWNNII